MTKHTVRKRIVIMGAAGRDFHNFNMVFRDDPSCEVVAFTSAQIPGIAGRTYPPSCAGIYYPDGIPIRDERDLASICRSGKVDEVIFAYSDVAHTTVMHSASIALASGADFRLLGPAQTMLKAHRPVIAVSATRTGAGKSQVSRWLSQRLRGRGLQVAVIRHPMPYGDLRRQAVQRFATMQHLGEAECTIEEREEYEPHIALGNVVYSGTEYKEILSAAESDSDIILWDGGNNDFPFLKPDLHIVLVDALRPGDEQHYHPGEAVLRMADLVIITKSNAARPDVVQRLAESVRAMVPAAPIFIGASVVTLDRPELVAGKSVLVVDDGPSLTHGGISHGAGYAAAVDAGAREVVDPRESAVGEIATAYERYPHIGKVLPALGYNAMQLQDLATTINRSRAEVVVSRSPIQLQELIKLEKPIARAWHEFSDIGAEQLAPYLANFIASVLPRHR